MSRYNATPLPSPFPLLGFKALWLSLSKLSLLGVQTFLGDIEGTN